MKYSNRQTTVNLENLDLQVFDRKEGDIEFIVDSVEAIVLIEDGESYGEKYTCIHDIKLLDGEGKEIDVNVIDYIYIEQIEALIEADVYENA